MKTFIAAVFTVAAVFGAAAHVASADTKLDAMASLVAGHPVSVRCDVDEPGTLGWTYLHGSTVYLSTYACQALSDPTSPLFGGGLHILAHEASHARGIANEACAEVWGNVWPMDLARRFYGVEFFTVRSSEIDLASQRIHEQTPPEYHGGC